MSHEVVFLSDADVRSMLDMEQTIEVVEEDFKRQADREAIVLGVPLAYSTDDRQLGFKWRLKAAVIRDVPVAGVRVTGYKIDEHGHGSAGEREATRYVVLSDPVSGSPLAIVDEHWSFALRTTAAACVAAKYLAKPDSKRVGVIGLGNMGHTSLLGLAKLFDIQEVRAFSRRREKREEFASKMSSRLGVPVIAEESYEAVCRDADIIVAGTPSTEPFIRPEWLKEGVFVAAVGHEEVGHDAFQEFDRIYVDYDREKQEHPAHVRNAIQSGGLTEEAISGEVWEVVSGKHPPRQNDREKILVLTVGLTSQDVAVAYRLYRRALAEGIGLRLPF